MKNVNSRSLVNSLLLVALFVLTGTIAATAQTGNLAGSGAAAPAKQPTYIGEQEAIMKILDLMPVLYAQIGNLAPETPSYKKKEAEALAYKQIVNDLNQGKPLAQAHADALQTLRLGFNLENNSDILEYRSVTVGMQGLLTTP